MNHETESLPRALDGLVQDAMKYAGQAWAMADELAKAQADLATTEDRLKDAREQIEHLEALVGTMLQILKRIAP